MVTCKKLDLLSFGAEGRNLQQVDSILLGDFSFRFASFEMTFFGGCLNLKIGY
jgi:hypothetical protein